jgi:hypothetical protein
MSKLLLYFLIFAAVVLLGLFGFFALSNPHIEQNTVTIDVPVDSLEQ